MYYPIGWHKVLNVDIPSGQEPCNIISVQANHERELFFILTTRSLHVWYPRPAVEIVCHRRSNESIESIGCNKTAVWRTDSSVIVVATEKDQLVFYQVRRRTTSTSAAKFLSPLSLSDDDNIYRLHHKNPKNPNVIFNLETSQQPLIDCPTNDSVPALTIFSFGKLDLSSVGVSCLMSAEEELIVGACNGNIYGIHWEGSMDDKFPWTLPKETMLDSGYVIDIKFSSVLAGFALVFLKGRIGFMPSKVQTSRAAQNGIESESVETRRSELNYLPDVDNAICVELNHRYRLVAVGLKNSKVLVCHLGDANSTLVVNHVLELQNSKFPHDTTKLGSVKSMRYSPDSFALVISWEGGDFAIWSVFGSLLFCSQQWQLTSALDSSMRQVRISCLAWGREGFNLWMSTTRDDCEDLESISESQSQSTSQDISYLDDNKASGAQAVLNGSENYQREEVLIMSIAHSNMSSNPHLTCSSDSIVLMSEDRLYVGPSVPHKDKFDHWIVIDIPQAYLNLNYPIKYASVDRECKEIAVAGNKGFAIYLIESSKWKYFSKKSQEDNFSVCGDLIWWQDYLVISSLNLENDLFEIRAYLAGGSVIDNDPSVVQTTKMEIVRMSIFENRLLVLYSDGTLGMFMLNSRIRPKFKRPNATLSRSNSIVSANVQLNGRGEQQMPSRRTVRSDSMRSFNPLGKQQSQLEDVVLQISPIENLVISNLQANAYCISSIALTRLHFKNNRSDDSILLNACGRLFLLEREAPPDLASVPSNSPDLPANDLNNLSLESHKTRELDINLINSAKRLSNSKHFASATLKNTIEPSALSNVTFKAVSVIATNVEQFWISPEISSASELSYFRKSLWLSCGGSNNYLQVWLPLLNDKNDPPNDLYIPDRIMLPIKCDIYPLAIRSSAPDVVGPDDAIVLGAESDIMYKDSNLFACFPYSTVKRQCRVYLHRILRELLLKQHLGYYARKIAESCQSLPYFAHCFELLLHEVLEEEATSPVPLPDPMLPQVVRFIKEFPVYLETVVHCARKSELSMWSHLFDERAVGNPRRLFQECLERHKLDTAASCLIILQSLDRNIVSQRMVKELIKAAKDDSKYNYLIEDLENFLSRAELDYGSGSGSPV